MFRAMRRKTQQLTEEENIKILARGKSGVLAVIGDQGYPYAVPLSYVYLDGKILFHSATTGHKIDAIKRNEKVSFCVVDKDEIHPEIFSTYYKSVIVFGVARIIKDKEEILDKIQKLTEKYSPDFKNEGLKEAQKAINNLYMIELTIEHITGKQSKYLQDMKS